MLWNRRKEEQTWVSFHLLPFSVINACVCICVSHISFGFLISQWLLGCRDRVRGRSRFFLGPVQSLAEASVT